VSRFTTTVDQREEAIFPAANNVGMIADIEYFH
jgi:hypothetical protein